MKIRFYGKEVALIVCFVLLLSVFSFAAEEKVVRSQGKVMAVDFAKKMVIISEKTFFWNQTTLFFDEKGSPISITADRLTIGTMVSIEATWIKNKPLVIKKLSFLPKK